MWTVYILRCADQSTYTRCTSNLDERLNRHSKGQVHYTSSRLPVEVITTIFFQDKYKAYEFEKYLKSGSGRDFAKRLFL
ncbi:MAG: GIY-YIG nuclease family protein [Bacteroidota bacterium]